MTQSEEELIEAVAVRECGRHDVAVVVRDDDAVDLVGLSCVLFALSADKYLGVAGQACEVVNDHGRRMVRS